MYEGGGRIDEGGCSEDKQTIRFVRCQFVGSGIDIAHAFRLMTLSIAAAQSYDFNINKIVSTTILPRVLMYI